MIEKSTKVCEAVGMKVRLLRQKRGYTAIDIARVLNIEKVRYDRYEEGQERFTAIMLHTLCELLKVTPATIFDGIAPTRH